MGECKERVHARCCDWLASRHQCTSAAFFVKAAAWPTAKASGVGRSRPVVTLPKGLLKGNINETGLAILNALAETQNVKNLNSVLTFRKLVLVSNIFTLIRSNSLGAYVLPHMASFSFQHTSHLSLCINFPVHPIGVDLMLKKTVSSEYVTLC